MVHVFSLRCLKEASAFDAGYVKNAAEGDTGYSGTICNMSSSHINGIADGSQERLAISINNLDAEY